MKCNFSFRHYKEILKMLKKEKYRFCFFDEDFKGKRVYLRHDIDYSPERALEMAKIEKQLGINSTFFVRFSPFYDIFEPKYSKIIKEIFKLGHQIGLHFEKGEINRQLEILKEKFGAKKVVSFHRPSESILGKKFEGFISAYEPRFFREAKYLSDSKGNWREGCVCRHQPLPKILHLVMHPIWWDKKEGDLNPKKRLREYLKEKKDKKLNNLLRYDNSIFRP